MYGDLVDSDQELRIQKAESTCPVALDFDAVMRFDQMPCIGETGVLVEISHNVGEK